MVIHVRSTLSDTFENLLNEPNVMYLRALKGGGDTSGIPGKGLKHHMVFGNLTSFSE